MASSSRRAGRARRSTGSYATSKSATRTRLCSTFPKDTQNCRRRRPPPSSECTWRLPPPADRAGEPLLDNDLPVHPRVWRADVIVVAWFVEGYRLRLARVQHPGIPTADPAVFKGGCGVRRVADILKSHRGPCFHAGAPRSIGIFDVEVADFDGVDTLGNRSGRTGDGQRWGRGPQRVQLPLQRKGPYGIPIGTADPLIAAGGNRDVLVTVDLVDHRGRLRAKTGLELPQLLAGLGIVGQDLAAGIAAKDDAAGCGGRAAAAAEAIRRLLLPSDFVGVAADRSKRAAHRRADRRPLGAAIKALPFHELGVVARKGAGSDGGGYVETAGVGIVRHRRPVRAADPGRLDQCRLFPEDLEDTSRSLVSLQRLGTLRYEGVADRKGLRFRCVLPRLLRHRPLLDADQRLAAGPGKNVNPAGAARLRGPPSRLAVDHGVEEDHRARSVVVPNVVMHLLEVPGVLSGLGLQRDDRGAEQIVSFAHRTVVIRPAIADGKIDKPELRIERRRVPDRATPAAEMIGAGRPGVGADLSRPG